MTASPLWGLPQGFPGHSGLPAHAPEGFCLCAQWESGKSVTTWFPGRPDR